jgi:hypothetical protein
MKSKNEALKQKLKEMGFAVTFTGLDDSWCYLILGKTVNKNLGIRLAVMFCNPIVEPSASPIDIRLIDKNGNFLARKRMKTLSTTRAEALFKRLFRQAREKTNVDILALERQIDTLNNIDDILERNI